MTSPNANVGNGIKPLTPAINDPLKPATGGNLHGTDNLTSPPKLVGACKNFGELKIYWAENYNVKLADEVAKLHFESVLEAMSGIEAILNEFPPAKSFLEEIKTFTGGGIMTSSRGHGIINFNPEYFSNRQKLLNTLAIGVKSRFYIKNATPVSVGAHKAGYIVEDWLIDKYNAGDVSLRIISRNFIREAYTRAIQTAEGKGKTISQLKSEISINANDKKISE